MTRSISSTAALCAVVLTFLVGAPVGASKRHSRSDVQVHQRAPENGPSAYRVAQERRTRKNYLAMRAALRRLRRAISSAEEAEKRAAKQMVRATAPKYSVRFFNRKVDEWLKAAEHLADLRAQEPQALRCLKTAEKKWRSNVKALRRARSKSSKVSKAHSKR